MSETEESLAIEASLHDVRATLDQRVESIASRLLAMLERSTSAPAQAEITNVLTFLRAFVSRAGNGNGSHSHAEGPLDRVTSAFALAPCEVDLIVLAGMAEEHEGLANVLRALHPRREARATVGLAAQLLCDSHDERWFLRKALERGAVVQSGALTLVGEAPFVERNLVLAEALWSALHGIDVWPASLARIDRVVRLAGLEEWLASPSALRAASALARWHHCTILITAESEDAALHRAAALAKMAGVPAERIALSAGAPASLSRLVELHSIVRGVVPLVRVSRGDGPASGDLALFDGYPGPAVVCTRAPAAAMRGGRPVLPLHVARLTPSARRSMWAAALPSLAGKADVLAARYAIDPSGIGEITADVTAAALFDGRSPTLEDVVESIRTRSAVGLSSGVSLVRPTASWDDLVLSRERVVQLREAVERQLQQARVIDQWGFLSSRPGARGVRMLFAGPPGTGKTLSAEVVARALGVDLLVVDIARIVSKWIGETEKNLAATFDLAESAQAVLFFDEADALFGKRTEVSDAHDRYANLETAYLLSRLERFEGLAVLSTNLRQNIDPAFIRRLEFIVDFDEPGLAEREALWRGHVPQGAPLMDDVSLTELAELYPVVGGFIRNAAVAAGFLAASEGGAIARRHFVRAIQREYEKSGRTFPGAPPGMRAR
jgi:hypothetical protein